MTRAINDVLIVGGGTAGWLSAAVLAKQLSGQQGINITLVESPNVPILGVGEGTWPNLRATLKKVGIDESEFMRECDATFKQGAEFINFAKTPESGKSDGYYHPLNTVFHSSYEFNLASYWLLDKDKRQQRYDLAVATQAHVCQSGLAPKKITTPAFAAVQEYSYHLNANKFADFLMRHCTQKLGVKHIKADVNKVNLDSSGYVESVETANAEYPKITADFFVDCSGGKAIIIEQAMDIGWRNINDVIFNDTAVAMQVPYQDPERPISSHTLVTAQEAGWIWDINLFNRRGVGHVYSSKYTSDDRAEALLREYIGPEAEGLAARKINMRLGYRDKFWHKNCVAIGMSAGFVEPLEASAIYLYDAAANMIADQFPRNFDNLAYVERKFNNNFKMRMERTIEFIKLHYCISQRRDSQYWIDNCDAKSIPENLLWRLEHWKTHPPTKYDFDFAWEPFNLDSYLYVLYGMHFQTDLSANASAFPHEKMATRMFSDIEKLSAKLTRELPSQRDLLKKVYEFGFSPV
ncbi:tryptophan 7-halogenase [Catenovulum sp. SM1970]|uniref:tryptophan halogenase family protein n=1 Tax=Marinifaba aquimaris TaxID=2741323 RepID=UPI001574DE28|nr:tryptophan halogenase family protein [Marinifaba aquimaris]NTS76741.1 tryptophan 7-halogenase [Marinifaba aquimaris]